MESGNLVILCVVTSQFRILYAMQANETPRVVGCKCSKRNKKYVMGTYSYANYESPPNVSQKSESNQTELTGRTFDNQPNEVTSSDLEAMNQPPGPQWMPDFGMGPGPQMRMRRRRFTRGEKEFAVGLLNRGWSCRRVARKLGCSSASPIRWRQSMRRQAAARARAPAPAQNPPAPVVVPFGPLPAAQQNGAAPAAPADDNCVIV